MMTLSLWVSILIDLAWVKPQSKSFLAAPCPGSWTAILWMTWYGQSSFHSPSWISAYVGSGPGMKAIVATILSSSHRIMHTPSEMSFLTVSSDGYESFHWFMFPLARIIPRAFSNISISAGMSSYVAFLIILQRY